MVRSEQQAREHLEVFSRLNPDNIDTPDKLLYLLTGVSRHVGKIIKGLWLNPPSSNYTEDTYLYDPRYVSGRTLTATSPTGSVLEVIINPHGDTTFIYRDPVREDPRFTSVIIPGDQQTTAISNTPTNLWSYTQYAAVVHGAQPIAHTPFSNRPHGQRASSGGYLKILNQSLGEFLEITTR